MTGTPFTHLEVHSHLSLLEATPSISQLVAAAQADGLPHLALTDTNALYAAVAFDRACRAANIRPLIGMTLTVTSPLLGGEGSGVRSADGEDPDAEALDADVGHLVLLAKDAAGYRSLCRLSSLIQGDPQRAALIRRGLPWAQLADHRTGLICLSGGRRGWIERYLRAGDHARAQMAAGRLAALFEEDAYLALELNRPGDEAIAAEVATLGRRLGLPTVAVQPIYALAADEAATLRLLHAIRQNRPLDTALFQEDAEEEADEASEHAAITPPHHTLHRERDAQNDLPASQQRPAGAPADDTPRHWLTRAQMQGRFAAHPDALAQTAAIAERCGACLPDGRPIWPSLALPAGQTADDALRQAAEAGLRSHYPDGFQRPAPGPPPATRLDHELALIRQQGFAPLFLVVADIVRFARGQGIPVSTRGSVANSLVAYCAGITTVDPIEHDLLFERFLNPARANPPDIDLDFCSRRRDEILRYVREAYGPERVALVCTVSTMRPQSAVREVGKAYGLDEAEIGRLADLMPHGWHPDARRRDNRTLADILPLLTAGRQREVVTAAWALIGQPDHLSVHPGGVVITPGPLTDTVPVQWAPKGFLVTQFEHGDVEAIGLPKLDLLGIRALTVLADAEMLIRQGGSPAFRLDAIPLQDPATGELLAHGRTIGVFQCESEGAQRTLRKLKAHTVRDLAIANAFFKPGPALGGMADAFVRRYRGEETVRFLHPSLAPILGVTHGVLIFQEQVLRLATEIAGLSWRQADHLRRGMSHFGAHQIAAVAEQFIQGCQRQPPTGPGFTAAQAHQLWEQIVPFAGYGFNQGHATAYASVSYRSAYLKTHYPAEFFCARLAGWGGFHHPAVYAAEAVRLGLHVRPPHVNHSRATFTLQPETNTLFMGLGQVRDLRHASAEAIIAAAAQTPFRSLRDLLSRVNLGGKEVDHLIRCGALDGLGSSRAALLAEAALLGRKGGAAQLAFDFAAPAAPAESPRVRLAWERQLLGWPVSVHPLHALEAALPPHVPLDQLPQTRGRPVVAAGARLPGWTGGPGFFLGDGATFVIVRTGREQKNPPAWQGLLVRGRWQGDRWGGVWLQGDSMELLEN